MCYENLKDSLTLEVILNYTNCNEDCWKSGPVNDYKIVNAALKTKYAALVCHDPYKEECDLEIYWGICVSGINNSEHPYFPAPCCTGEAAVSSCAK